MSLHKAVSIVYQVMDEMGLTSLEKGRILAEISEAGAFGNLSQKAWGVLAKVNERLAKAGIAVAGAPDDDGA